MLCTAMDGRQTGVNRKKHIPGRRLSVVIMVFYFLAFVLLASRNQDTTGYLLSIAVPCIIFLCTHLLPLLFPADRLLMSLSGFLCALGVLLLYDTNPGYAKQQALAYGVGLIAMVFCIYLVRMIRSWRHIVRFLIPFSLLLLALPLLMGKEINGAKNWIVLGGFSFQPSELVKLSLLLVLSCYLSRQRFIPWFLFALACLILLMLQKDLGTALLYYAVTLLLYWSATGNVLMSLLGLAGGGGAAWFGYRMFAHVRRRVSIWLNPWSDFERSGYQLIQGLMAIASGGLWGVGLGLGTPTSIPVYESDFIFAVLCEQFGLIFGVCVLLIYVAIIWRGMSIAVAARFSFHGLLAMGATILIGFQTFVIVGGVLKLIPLTGVTLPFISYGGTSLVSSMCLTGFIQGVASLNEEDLKEDAKLGLFEHD